MGTSEATCQSNQELWGQHDCMSRSPDPALYVMSDAMSLKRDQNQMETKGAGRDRQNHRVG